jgi:hypothetical protein
MRSLRFSRFLLIVAALSLAVGATRGGGLAGGTGGGSGSPPPPPPLVITEFDIIYDDDGWWLFKGNVSGGTPTITITFGGYAPIQGMTTEVNPDGSFCLPIQVTAQGGTQLISATATDAAGNTSVPVWDFLLP